MLGLSDLLLVIFTTVTDLGAVYTTPFTTKNVKKCMHFGPFVNMTAAFWVAENASF